MKFNRNHWLWQFTKYALVGILGFILDLLLFFTFTRKLGLPLIPANICSVLIVIGHNFLWHKYLTFRVLSAEHIKREFRRFFLISGSAFVIQQIGLPLLVLLPAENLLGEWEDFAMKFAIATVVGITSFIINRIWTFGTKSPKALKKSAA